MAGFRKIFYVVFVLCRIFGSGHTSPNDIYVFFANFLLFFFQKWLKQWRMLRNWMWNWLSMGGIWCRSVIRMSLGQEGHHGKFCLLSNKKRRARNMNRMWRGQRATDRGLKISSPKICNDILSMIEEHLLPSSSTVESAVFYYKMWVCLIVKFLFLFVVQRSNVICYKKARIEKIK